ncbi:phosphopentomutase-like [Oppia nitens]|uniref:phosphopentomutase-like n=1 Tax=Oppia nitens TaxID=1686743 RepID=UPI0023DC0C97|nr:phosphopentomutase-like [Oppia nitens]
MSNIKNMNEELKIKIDEWLNWDQNTETLNEIRGLVDGKQTDKLSKLLLNRLDFGTAGLRGRMGAGYAAMNDLVVIQTSQGLAKYLLELDEIAAKNGGVVIGYDGRHNSERFARLSANTFLTAGIKVHLFSTLVPTPFVAYAIRLLSAAAGLMVTASHNPKQDNGYKVYFSNGAQITSPHDKNIQKHILINLEPWTGVWVNDPRHDNKCMDPLDIVWKNYFTTLESHVYDKKAIQESNLRIVYTPIHGVGHRYLTEAFRVCGLKNYFPVESQMKPDPEFSTVVFPNPEEGKGVLDESFKTAATTKSTLIIANDPDSDRCAVAEYQSRESKWRIFTGNELGALFGWWQWFKHSSRKDASKPVTKDVYMISSTVSSKILESMAKVDGFNWLETLTGFKWMANKGHELEKLGKTVLFAYEEAIGFMVGTTVLDKDGISAAADILGLAVYLDGHRQCNLADHLTTIYNTYGYHYSLNSYYICYDQKVIKQIFDRLATFDGTPGTYPKRIGGYDVVRVRDLNRGYDSATTDKKPILPTSSSSYMLTFYFSNGFVLTIRTSGTEPKIKYYSEAIAPPENKNWTQIETDLHDLVKQTIAICLEPEKNDIQPKSD